MGVLIQVLCGMGSGVPWIWGLVGGFINGPGCFKA